MHDVRLGSVPVGGYHDGPIAWPYVMRPGAHSLILTETLARMVRQEAARDVAEALGVSGGTVWRWRRELGVGRRDNPGTLRRLRGLPDRNIPPEAAQRGRRAAQTPQAAGKRRRARRRARGEGVGGVAVRWTPEMDAALGTLPDRDVAEQLGLSALTVSSRRARLGIPSYRSQHRDVRWTPEMDAALYAASARELAERWGVSVSTVKARRRRVGGRRPGEGSAGRG
ncbi:hypothetical protein [Deinococcus sp. RL]|uniref:hypothetical protein n=1 Tax=Deinococcus sp. RL TaxID=1489678 RepID=UPI0012687E2D|nr:hypothetical protein [Deinococcus sp. RL]